MADKKKRKESAQTHVKREQSTRKRRRVKGKFAAGNVTSQQGKLSSLFHQAVNLHGIGVHKAIHPRQGQLFDEHDFDRGLPRTDSAGETRQTGTQTAQERAIAEERERQEQQRVGTTTSESRARRRNQSQGQSQAPRGSGWRSEMPPEEERHAREYVDDIIAGPYASMYEAQNVAEARDSERRRGGEGGGGDDSEFVPFVERGDPYEPDDWGVFQVEAYQKAKRALEGELSPKKAERMAQQWAFELTKVASTSQSHPYGRATQIDTMRELFEPRTRKETAEERLSRIDATGEWKTHRGTLPWSKSPPLEQPISLVRGKKRPSQQEIVNMLPPSQRQWLENQFSDQSSNFYGADAQRKEAKDNLSDYLALAYDGYSTDEIVDWFHQGKPDEIKPPRGRKDFSIGKEMENMATQDMQERKYGSHTGLKDKYASGTGSHEGFSYSMEAAGVDDMQTLRKRFPDASEADVVRYRESQRARVDEYMLEANERWAHETRAARVRGKGNKANIEEGDRVVMFTTNVGAPTVTVPANNLLGQYIIKKRKKMLVDEHIATRSQVKGEFPRAVRDQHLIEYGTGVSLGIQGRAGVFQNTGWRVGSKRSKGYGKKAPVGAHVLRDSSGAPVFDRNGNVRYTEGYTRPFDVGTDRNVGLRIFLG